MTTDMAATQVPPSTLAAQIVEQHSTGRRKQVENSTFRQLLEEIRLTPSAVENDFESNVKLISVVADAGLDATALKDPFGDIRDTENQIVACLHVIEIAIKRTPSVLSRSIASPDDADFRLSFVLLAKMITLSAHEPLRVTLYRSMHFVSSSMCHGYSKWTTSKAVKLAFHTWVQAIYDTLFKTARPKAAGFPTDVTLPSASTIGLDSARAPPQIAVTQGPRIVLRSLDHAVAGITLLLDLGIQTVQGATPRQSDDCTGSEKYRTSVIYMLSSLWQHTTALESDAACSGMESIIALLLDIIAPPTSHNPCSLTDLKAFMFLIQCVCSVAASYQTLANESLRRKFVKAGSLIASAAKCSCRIKQQTRGVLVPRLQKILQDTDAPKKLGPETLQQIQAMHDRLLNNQTDPAGHYPGHGPRATHSLATDSSDHALNGILIRQSNGVEHVATGRPAKRRRLQAVTEQLPVVETPDDVIRSICIILGNWNPKDLESLREAAPGLFADLEEYQQILVLKLLGDMHCSNGCSSETAKGINESSIRCEYCGKISSQGFTPSISDYSDDQSCLGQDILITLLESDTVQSSKYLRVKGMNAIRQAACHTRNASRLDLNESSVGKWCLQGLRSSFRELRIAAGKALAMFLRSGMGHNDELHHKNRVTAFNVLRTLSQSKDARICETVILALGEAVLVCGEEEVNLVLLQLVEFLGDTNTYICGLAHLELRRLAQSLGTSMDELIRPFWRSVAINAVRDVLANPQKAQQLSDLLGCSVNQLLKTTQSYTVPYIVLWGHMEILARIAAAQGEGATAWDVCMTPSNLTATLALLFIHHPGIPDAVVTECLTRINPSFRSEDVDALLRVDTIAIAREILKSAADADESSKEKALLGFRDFTSIVERRGHSTRTSATQARMTALFFENHALGIMASFSDTVESPVQSKLEKKRCLNAIDIMIDIGRKDIAMTIPQIRACLQSALDVAELCNHAFGVWASLLSIAEAEDLESLICETFSIIALKWDVFNSKTQSKAHDVLSELLRNYGSLIQDMAESIPSLGSIPIMSKLESQLARLRAQTEVGQRLASFARRCQAENALIVTQALRELLPYLEQHQQWVHDSASTEQPNPVIAELARALLDTCARFNDDHTGIAELCAQGLGIIGCLDTNRVESVREQRETLIMLSNFSQAGEAIEFVTFILENVLVKAFHSVSNPRAQGFLAYVMQELLRFCGFNKDVTGSYHPQGTQADQTYQRWLKLPEPIRNTLTPFLTSRYVLTTNMNSPGLGKKFPLYSTPKSHSAWVRDFSFYLLQNGSGENAKMIFNVLARVIRGYDVKIASFLLPYAAANVIIDGTNVERQSIGNELVAVMKQATSRLTSSEDENLKHCSENVFQVLDYLSRWLQEKKKTLAATRNLAERAGRPMDKIEETKAEQQIANVDAVFALIPADMISRRALECKSFARALLHWEHYMRSKHDNPASKVDSDEEEAMNRELQNIYMKIDEPDGIEGVSAHLRMLSPQQQALEHQRAGRWAAAQSWYELQLKEKPHDIRLHEDVLGCLNEAAQFDTVIKHARTAGIQVRQYPQMLGTIARAAWSVQDWNALDTFAALDSQKNISNFDLSIGSAMLALRRNDMDSFSHTVETVRLSIAKSLSGASIDSLQACRDQLFQLHVLYEVQVLSGGLLTSNANPDPSFIDGLLDRRLGVLGSSVPDKQYLLGIQRATMHANKIAGDARLAKSWMTTAKLARKALPSALAYEALFHASELGDPSAKIEQSRLLWDSGEHRKAIQSLEGAIIANKFAGANDAHLSGAGSVSTSATNIATATSHEKPQQNILVARAHLLLAKWLDRAGQSQYEATLVRYRQATVAFARWEKGYYYLGNFYNKLHDSEKALPIGRQGVKYLNGETAKLVIENYLRSLSFGCKYLFQTLPKVLTLWLELGDNLNRKFTQEVPDDVKAKVYESRQKMMDQVNKQVRKYADKIQSYILYTAIAQMVSRITHSNSQVWEILSSIITKVVAAHPQQALWSILAVVKSKEFSRSRRGNDLLTRLKVWGSKTVRHEGHSIDLKDLVTRGTRMSEELLNACEVTVEGRVTMISLTKTLGFKTRVAPCPLVIPLEKTLFASLPAVHTPASLRAHKAFPATRDAITISSFEDQVLVLASLQKPRKITIKGSDGRTYGLLCKPNDDLRKDQRLMEFNAMINRGLKKDAASSARRLYVKTYAVTPLNEGSGLIEWVEGLKPMRDILLALYKTKGTRVDYALLRELLADACKNPPGSTAVFTETILAMYRPLLHEWFTELFPVPDAWYAARQRYARSCAVASMVGHALGLGDRHGENVLLEEKTGGIFHVDFNCLFDKGLTFEKPELVPFRLTHNMVDAMGATGIEGAFRRAAECAMGVMREQEDALLTILETFVHDPTADFVGVRRKVVKRVPDSPKEVLESVRGKVRGLMMGESLALSVQGHVDALIRQATNPANLSAMYIGWCAFL